ncbi:MAG: AI-2E family transporter [Synergistaceae bacterium]
MTDFRSLVNARIKESVMPFVLLIFLFLFLTWLIIKPLGMPLLWSVVLSYLAYPFYSFVYSKINRFKYSANIAASLTTLVILLFMVIPLLVLGVVLTRETFKIYQSLMYSGFFTDSFDNILLKLYAIPYIGVLAEEINAVDTLPMLKLLLSGAVDWLTDTFKIISTRILGNAFKIFYLLAVVAISSFFIVRDGHLVLEFMTDVIPLPKETSSVIFDKTALMLRAVVYGIVMTASVQGILGALGWWFVGLPHPAFFGFVMFIVGMIPFVGTPSVWIPGAIFLVLQGDVINASVLFLWGIFVVSTIDNFIRPIFISDESKVHVLVIFIGIFGGLYNWGIIGLFIGPVVLSLGMFVLDIYRSLVTEKVS